MSWSDRGRRFWEDLGSSFYKRMIFSFRMGILLGGELDLFL